MLQIMNKGLQIKTDFLTLQVNKSKHSSKTTKVTVLTLKEVYKDSRKRLYTHTHTAHTHTMEIILLPRSCAPGRARMPMYYAGTVNCASKAPGAGLGTRRRKAFPLQQVPPGPLLFHEKRP